MSIHLPVYKDAPSDGQDYVRKDGYWQVSSGAGGTVGAATLQSGFDDKDDSTIAFDDGTRTFTITPTGAQYDIYQVGTLYEITTAKSIVIDDTEGLHFIYFDEGTLYVTQTFVEEIITQYVFVCAVHWNALDNESVIVGEERHGREMDSATHLYLHETRRAAYGNGLGLNSITTDATGSSDTHAQFGVASGSFWDEDIHHVITAGASQALALPAELPILHRFGSGGSWKKLPATTFPVTTTGTGRLAWNEWTGATWQVSEVGNNDFALVHIFATNDINEPIMVVMGNSTYGNVAAARAGALEEITTLTFGDLDPLTLEFVPLGTVIYQTSNGYTNSVKSRVRSTDDGDEYIDWRTTEALGSGGSGSGTTDPDAIHKSVANEFTALTEKATPVAGDYILIEDSAASYVKKAIQISNLPFDGPGHTHTESEITDLAHYTHPATHPWSILTGTPTTLSGYGISDTQANFNTACSDGTFSFVGHTHTISQITDFTDNSSNWDTAYGWGNHASQGYLTSFTETDPTVPSNVKAITGTQISNWDTAYGWGDHSSQGYLTAASTIDADTLNGKTSTAEDTASTIMERDVSGDAFARLFRSDYQNQTTISGAMAFRVDTTDNYIRFCSDTAAIRTWLGVSGDVDHGTAYPASNLGYTGLVEKFIAGGTVTAGYAVAAQMDTARGEVIHADADLSNPLMGVAINGGAAGTVISVLTKGYIKLTGPQFAATAGNTVAVSTTAGYMRNSFTALSTNDYQWIVGYCPATDILYVSPTMNWVQNA